jgi:Asp-tRNA(Asn)/Glu-tRNA(Gln) amidotransferase C subunit
MREDRVSDGVCRAAILKNAPRTAPAGDGEIGFFAVPKVIE